MQNLVTIPQGVSFPRMREFALSKCLLGCEVLFSGFFQRPTGYRLRPWTDFHA